MRAPLCLLLLLAGCATARPHAPIDERSIEEAAGELENAVLDLETERAGESTPRPPEPTEPAYAGPAYFPPSLGEYAMDCAGATEVVSQPVLSDFERNWYSRQLAAAGEPSLYLASQAQRPAGASTLRFTWLRSFHAPVTIRIETAGPGSHRLIAKRLSGAGGYDPGVVEKIVERRLTSAEAGRLQTMLAGSRVFDLVPNICQLGFDGAEWIFESVDAGGYHFVSFWTPREGPANALGRLLMGLTGWDFGEVY